MTESGNIYGKKSYEFAVGRIKAGERLLSAEQWSRLRAAPRADAEKLIAEYGYSSDSDVELNRTVDFLKEISPDADLTELLSVSDSIFVMCEGRIVAYFPDASAVDEQVLGEYMLGLKTMSKEEMGGVLHG